MITNYMHNENPDMVQNEGDYLDLAQNGTQSTENSLPGKEIDKLP